MGNLIVETASQDHFPSRWDEYVSSHPDATAYHYSEWASVFATLGYRCIPLIARREEQVVGCLPLYVVKSLISKKLVSVPFRDRGGVLYDNDEAFTALVNRAQQIARQHNAGLLELKSIRTLPSGLLEQAGLRKTDYWIRSVVDLRKMSNDEYWRHLPASVRNKVRQATKAGLSFQSTTGPQAVNAWYDLHLRTQHRLGVPPFPRIFFERMITSLTPKGRCSVYFVMQQDRPIAGSIVLLERTQGIYAYSASSSEHWQLRPNDFMINAIIARLRDEGYSRFDFGSDSPMQQPLLHYKKKWGASQNILSTYLHGRASLQHNDSSSLRYSLPRRLFRMMPSGFYAVSGCRIVKYFG